MTYLVLARKWRPRSFDTLVGQDHVVRALTHALATQRLHHAWLFTGTRGVGKTTLSRILAKSLNCEDGITATPCGKCRACVEIDAGRFVDYLELDAASNRGVDEMTQLLEQAVYAPSSGRFKVYMIDEVHMLTGHAFNAMLKTLEEPPAHVKFILATTDPQKIPVTVLSRCLQFNLKQMTAESIVSHLQEVLAQEGIPFQAPALRLLAQAASGSMRDALSLTDQAIAYSAGDLTVEAMQGMLGTIDQRYLARLLHALAAGSGAEVLRVADELATRGLSYSGALADLAILLSRVAIQQRIPGALDPAEPMADAIVELAGAMHPDLVQLFYSVAVHSRNELALAPDEYAGFVMACLRMLALAPKAQSDDPGGSGRAPSGGHSAGATPLGAKSAGEAVSASAPASAPVGSASASASSPEAAPSEPVTGSASVTGAAQAPVIAPSPAPLSDGAPTPAPADSKRGGPALQDGQQPAHVPAEPEPQAPAASPAAPQGSIQDASPPDIQAPAETASLASGPMGAARDRATAETVQPARAAEAAAPSPPDDVPAWEDIPPDAEAAQFEPYGMADDAADEFLAGGADGSFMPADDDSGASHDAAAQWVPDTPLFEAERPRIRSPRLAQMTAKAWPALAAKLPVTGLAAELARQSEWLGVQDDQIRLRVAVRTLAATAGRQRLRTVLSEHFGTVVQLDVEFGATGEETAHAVAQAERAARQKQAEQAVQEDPFVRALIDEFGAQLIPGSVRAMYDNRAA
ncbi:DNA polymerase III subunit gamma/tau [Pusillimonas sp.]|uniref:DNA polymerase III subunit gamma/tau n=1 Tax=Pusillimonas sp. TaxID=3040095 RepID=UPI0029AE8731|nr:DNA polymerase III subunit gamma/tau [Pusillimonas sp.]MDX3895949.1 DNA polymerase III subunit gamma/tau [Pusillimonas sp.]